jgi:hypothetical protein
LSPSALSEPDEPSDLLRDATRAAVGYWGRLGRLAFESAAALVPLVAELRPGEAAPAPPLPAAPVIRTILVEAEAGQLGLGVFLVENTTTQQMSIPLSASPFVDAEGREVHAQVTFRPNVATLDPGDQLAVQVAVAVNETLEPDVRYRAEIGVPGLSETRIPIVVRRRAHTTTLARKQAKATTRVA